jgi:hypothetical protein
MQECCHPCGTTYAPAALAALLCLAVFRAIDSWHGYQRQHCSSPSDQELVQLLQQIRMPHCTQPFVATVLSESPLAAKCFSPLELRLACICSNSGLQPEQPTKHMEEASCPVLDKFPAWKQPKRPASAMDKLSMEREVGGSTSAGASSTD